MINRRRSRIVARRSQTIGERVVAARSGKEPAQTRHETADDRRADCSVSGSVKIARALGWRENRSKQHGGRLGGNFAASKCISSLSL